jgi:hypothetical protein
MHLLFVSLLYIALYGSNPLVGIASQSLLVFPIFPAVKFEKLQNSDTLWKPISYIPFASASFLLDGVYMKDCDYTISCPGKGSELIETRISGDTITLTWSFRDVCCKRFRAEMETGKDSTVHLMYRMINKEFCNCVCCYKMKYVLITKKDPSNYKFVHHQQGEIVNSDK